MRCFVTGGAGFIGSHLADTLLKRGHEVVVYDNLSTGSLRFLDSARQSRAFTFIKGDVLDTKELERSMKGCDAVFHLAANADVRRGPDHPDRDLRQNTEATFNVLEAMRRSGIRRIAFSSTGSVYGEPEVFPTPEDAPFPVQTSLYAASKLAGEALISSYCFAFGFQSFVFRFVSILGERYSHGHIFDFYRSLRENPHELRVLGDGHQRKSYLYVDDCVAAMLLAIERATEPVNIFNLGTDEYCEVNDSIRWITQHLGLSPKLAYTGGIRGWVGDSPFIFLDCSRIRRLGWVPTLSIREAVIRTVNDLRANAWVFEVRQ
jgi:UDP-glucose 4-epimerase